MTNPSHNNATASSTPRRGRPPIASYCVDCFREGLSPNQAGPKVYGSSYCKRHQNIRQNNSKKRSSQRKELMHGKWNQLLEKVRPELVKQQEEHIARTYQENDAWVSPVQIALHKPYAVSIAFEHECVRHAVEFGRRLTIAEENEIIASMGGSRTGFDAISVEATESAPIGPVLLPNPRVRERFRAQLNGGPTTEGEPSFTAYYEKFFGSQPPEELQEEADADESVIASDGTEVSRGILEEYERFLKRKKVSEAVREREDVPTPVEESDYFSRMNDIP